METTGLALLFCDGRTMNPSQPTYTIVHTKRHLKAAWLGATDVNNLAD